MSRIYRYIGTDDLRSVTTERRLIRQPRDVARWAAETRQQWEGDSIVATFVVDTGGLLWIADRRSEHVVCAAGGSVLSAAQTTFASAGKQVVVAEVTNQSLGYCPEPDSWQAVAEALDRVGLSHPNVFTTAFLIRRCDGCCMKNVVKDGVFECGVCRWPLSREWNFG